ncbi:MAG: DUF2974 domain-containing protein [Blautia sp.]|nr:DUF2974 domain-containing protein [Blautia sp.]
MIGTIIDYLKEYGDTSFRETPMNEVDSLVLCQFAYLKFDGIVPGAAENLPSVRLKDLEEHPDYENLYADERYEKANRKLVTAMLAGRRYRNMKMNCYVNFIEKESETQFSAVTLLLDDGTIYVAFRGTDETIVGWKEDFNMAFLSPVPGQAYSVKYLNAVGSRLHRPFYVGGHSKGGNLAVYSSMNCRPEIQDRIIRIYSMDGPGFRPEVLKEANYSMIARRVEKILPHSSLVGMLFESDMRFKVVESRTFGLLQHNPYTWLVKDGRLVEVKDIYESRRQMDNTLNEWILSLDEEQLRIFVDTLFQVINASQADDLIQFTAEWRKSMNGIVAALKEVDEQTAGILKEVIRSLFDIAGARMRQNVANSTAQLKQRLKMPSKIEGDRRRA